VKTALRTYEGKIADQNSTGFWRLLAREAVRAHLHARAPRLLTPSRAPAACVLMAEWTDEQYAVEARRLNAEYLNEHPITYDPLSGRFMQSGNCCCGISNSYCMNHCNWNCCCSKRPLGNPRVDTSRGTSGPFDHTHRPSQLMAICGVLSAVGFCHSLSLSVGLSVRVSLPLWRLSCRTSPATHLQLHDTDRGGDRLLSGRGLGLVPGMGRD
jgi:hypothetical protein